MRQGGRRARRAPRAEVRSAAQDGARRATPEEDRPGALRAKGDASHSECRMPNAECPKDLFGSGYAGSGIAIVPEILTIGVPRMDPSLDARHCDFTPVQGDDQRNR